MGIWAVLAIVLLAVVGTAVLPAFAGDPSGAMTGGIQDVPAAKAGAPTLAETAAQVGRNKVGLNLFWTLFAGFMVFFMQAGFALVETGFTRAKNAAHTMTMNFVVFLVGALGFMAVGFPLMFGGFGALGTLGGSSFLNGEFAVGGWGLFGTKGWFLSGGAYDVAIFAFFFFQMVFMDTTATIPTGAMAERVKFSAVVVMTLFISMFLYPIFGNWVWGGGWLAQLGEARPRPRGD
jgi:Amt family ammonium transporter